ncbi:ferredoxin reductase [Aquabacterium soli]|uniref:Ferredoxin reductase n=1 Tax=Aquabacterium soli TaxID=2493092 RepID=A0A426VBL5_9BURK|nr:ferredoxin reductase [Aquabacterium soli]RRS04254.1 ferredoxin reductase [Aquabacterium soli]
MTTASFSAPRSGLARRLLQPLVSPEVFDFWAALVRPGTSWNRPLGRIVARHEAARDAVTLLIQPNRHWRGFQPGQHLNVGAQVGGRWVQRSYSLSGIPRRDGRIAITVRRVEGGVLSEHLTGRARVGEVLSLGPAFGDMIWPGASSDAPAAQESAWLFLAAGSGITPLMSLTRAWAAAGTPADLTLVYWARTREELCFAEELRALALREARFRVHFVMTRQDGLRDTELQGRLNEARLESIVPDLPRRQIYACGPAGFVDTARRVAAPRARSFHAEAFTPPLLAAVEPQAGTVAVHLSASNRTLQLPVAQSLLTALEEQGVRPASGCRMGICRTCVCPKTEGTTQNLGTGELHHGHDSALRLCVSRACSDLTLNL